jgi:hypothetical protein
VVLSGSVREAMQLAEVVVDVAVGALATFDGQVQVAGLVPEFALVGVGGDAVVFAVGLVRREDRYLDPAATLAAGDRGVSPLASFEVDSCDSHGSAPFLLVQLYCYYIGCPIFQKGKNENFSNYFHPEKLKKQY